MHQTRYRAHIILGLVWTVALAACSGDADTTGASSRALTPGADITADDFNTGSLDAQLWTVVDPQGDGTVSLVGAGTPDAHLLLSVPTGTLHDAWTNNTALRVMQAISDEDFEVEVKFESEPTQQYQSQGLLVQQDASNYVRFDLFYGGGSLRVFSATFSNGSPTVRVNAPVASGPTTYLRLGRSGNQWTARYSYDGTNWTSAASFSHALAVSSAGVFAGNYWPNPAYTAVVDYFQETSAPITPEDPPLCDPTVPLLLTTQAVNGTVVRDPDQTSYSCGDVVTLTAQPDPGATFVGWGGALSGTTNPSTLTINEDATVTATFDLDTTAPQVTNVNVAPSETSATVSWQTDELSVGAVEYGATTAYELGSVPSSTLSTAHAVMLPGLVDGQTYHFRVTAEDSLGNSATGSDATFTTTSATCALTTQATNGTILRNPNAGTYACGELVTLTAQPAPGATFVGWSGALSGSANPATLTVDADLTVTASFALDTTPPQIGNVSAVATASSATVSWQTDELSVGFVEYGLTSSYGLGSVESTALSTSHSVTLPGLVGGQTYHYRVTAEDVYGNGISTGDFVFTTTSSGGGTGGTGGAGGSGGGTTGAIQSDDFFSGVLDTGLWQVVDPQGDGTVQLVGAETPDAQLELSVPQGTTHDAWSNNTTLRVMQPAADEDFEIEVKFESEPTQQYQSQGLLVEQDATNYVRFDLFYGGGSLRVFSATFNNGSPTVRVNSPIASGSTTYLRLARSGDQWTARYSYDGSSWTTATSFSHALTVWSVGVFAGNFTPNPAFTAVVDYFFDTASPLDPEDAPLCDPSEEFTVAATSVGAGAVSREPNQASYVCGEVVSVTALPDPGAEFLGWSGDISGSANPLVLTVGSNIAVTATFQIDQLPPQISNVGVTANGSSATISWQTDEPSTGFVEYGSNPSYGLGPVASSSSSTTHSVTLSGLSEGETYHYSISAEDSLGNSASTSDATFAAVSGGPNINVWYGESQSFGALGNPQPRIDLVGQVNDPDGLSSLTYSLNGGAPRNLSVGPYKRLAEPGDFNVDLDIQQLQSGTNTVEIRAVDGLGFVSTKVVSVDYSAGNTWPLDYEANWASAADINDIAQVVDGRWRIAGGELRNDLMRYDRLVAVGDSSWTDYQVTVPVTVHGLSAEGFAGTNGTPGVGVMLKWPGHSDWNGEQPYWGYYPGGGGGWVAFNASGIGELTLQDFSPSGVYGVDPFLRSIVVGIKYIWKLRVESQPDGSVLYQMKLWVAGSSEPANWELAGVDTNDVPSGAVILIAHFADVSFGDVVVEPL